MIYIYIYIHIYIYIIINIVYWSIICYMNGIVGGYLLGF